MRLRHAAAPVEIGDGRHHGFAFGLRVGDAHGIRKLIVWNIDRRFHEAKVTDACSEGDQYSHRLVQDAYSSNGVGPQLLAPGHHRGDRFAPGAARPEKTRKRDARGRRTPTPGPPSGPLRAKAVLSCHLPGSADGSGRSSSRHGCSAIRALTSSRSNPPAATRCAAPDRRRSRTGWARFSSTNGRNKRGIVLDLTDSRGLAAMMRLMDGRDEADDLIEAGVTIDGRGGDWAQRAEPHERGDLAVIIAPSERLAMPRASKLASSSQS